MGLYIGVDFHPHQQTAAWCDTDTGQIKTVDLRHHTPQVELFYRQFQHAVVGIEASVNAVWFEQLLAQLGHELRVGNPVLIRARARSRHKSDQRDAGLILDLLLKIEFPALWRRSSESNQILEIMRLRQSLVGQRTQVYNRLQALAHDFGLALGQNENHRFPKPIEELSDGAGRVNCSAFNSLICWRNWTSKSRSWRRGSKPRQAVTSR